MSTTLMTVLAAFAAARPCPLSPAALGDVTASPRKAVARLAAKGLLREVGAGEYALTTAGLNRVRRAERARFAAGYGCLAAVSA